MFTGSRPAPSSRPSTHPGGCVSPAPIPVNLRVCHESRTECLRHYPFMFAFAGLRGMVPFNPALDTLYFGARPDGGWMAAPAQLRSALRFAEPAELARVRRVAIDEAAFFSHNVAVGMGVGFGRPCRRCCRHRISADLLPTPVAGRLPPPDELFDLLPRHLPGIRELVFVSSESEADLEEWRAAGQIGGPRLPCYEALRANDPEGRPVVWDVRNRDAFLGTGDGTGGERGPVPSEGSLCCRYCMFERERHGDAGMGRFQESDAEMMDVC